MTCVYPACAKAAPETGQPQLKLLDTPSVSLGKIHAYEEKRVPFRFKNTSSTPASVLALHPTCPCVQGAADKMLTPPGEEMVVTLILNPSDIHGDFQRGLWVNFNDPAQKRVLLNVTGEVEPLFAGMPSEPLSLQSMDTSVVWTNRYTLTAGEAGFRLGAPQAETNAGLRTEVTLVTNTTERISYDLTLVVTPLAPGRHRTSVTLPVEGGSRPLTLRLDLQARVGLALAISPVQLNLYASGSPVTQRLLVRTDDDDVKAAALTWTPRLEGVKVDVKPTKRSSNLLVTVQLAPEAIRQLRAQKDAQLLFRYPKHTSAAVRFVAVEGSAPDPEVK